MPILGSSNPVANKNTCIMSKIWTNGVTLSDLVENMGKGEIARFKTFSIDVKRKRLPGKDFCVNAC